jgi:hypothetical protein
MVLLLKGASSEVVSQDKFKAVVLDLIFTRDSLNREISAVDKEKYICLREQFAIRRAQPQRQSAPFYFRLDHYERERCCTSGGG